MTAPIEAPPTTVSTVQLRPRWRLGRRPALDGLRGVAILLVLACHMLDAFFAYGRFHTLGSAGVVVFFTLSGFLITSLLLEAPQTGLRPLGRFYRNRVLRLYPAMVVAVLVIGGGQVILNLAGWGATVPVLLYYANWSTIAQAPPTLLLPMWSLSIEEQFYLVWPLVFLLVRRWRNGPLLAAFAGIALSLIARFTLIAGGATTGRIYFGSDTQASTLLLGCLLAVLAHRGLRPLRVAWRIPLGVCGLTFLSLVTRDSVGDYWVPLLVPVVSSVIIWAACTERSLLDNVVLQNIGRRAYGLYLWQCAIIWPMAAYVGRGPFWALVTLGLVLVVGQLSYRFVEMPFLRLKARSDRVRTPQVPVVEAVVVAPSAPLVTDPDPLEPIAAEEPAVPAPDGPVTGIRAV